MAEFTLTDRDDGTRLTVRVGDVITLHLSENSAAGYHWEVSSFDDTRLSVDSHVYQPAGGAVGSAGTAIWRLSVRQAGDTRIEFKKSRPWESSPIARLTVDVDISD